MKVANIYAEGISTRSIYAVGFYAEGIYAEGNLRKASTPHRSPGSE
jgi:hypothetical protein